MEGGATGQPGGGVSRPPGGLVLPGHFRAVVFDLDGLLVATEPVWSAAEADLLARHGGVHLPEDQLETIGRSVDESIAVYARRMGIGTARLGELRGELIELFLARLSTVVPMPGAADLVRSLAGRLPLGVASSSPRVVVGEVLAAAGFDATFDVVVTADDVSRHKPAPDPDLEVGLEDHASSQRAGTPHEEWPRGGATRCSTCGMLDIDAACDLYLHPWAAPVDAIACT